MWTIEYLPEAEDDLRELDGNQRLPVIKMIRRVARNPLPQSEGGCGKPLGNKNENDLTGLLKIKLKSSGIRVVYTIVRTDGIMKIVVIGARADEEVYKNAGKRAKKYDL